MAGMSKTILKRHATLLPLLAWVTLLSPVSEAETVFVVGSYNNAVKAEEVARDYSEKLGVAVAVSHANVAGVSRHRLLIANELFDEAVAEKVAGLGVSPWRLNQPGSTADLTTAAVTPVLKGNDILVGSFSSIDEALSLERQLSDSGFTVSGKAELQNGAIVHQVWVGNPDGNRAVVRRLESMQLNLTQNPAGKVATAAPVQIEVQQTEKPALETKPVKSSPAADSRYPKDFNLARLPPKKE